jgi:hypothetical protein
MGRMVQTTLRGFPGSVAERAEGRHNPRDIINRKMAFFMKNSHPCLRRASRNQCFPYFIYKA